jgi:hypothetical protein
MDNFTIIETILRDRRDFFTEINDSVRLSGNIYTGVITTIGQLLGFQA